MKISIIIPIYNRASLLPRAVRSVPQDVSVEIIIIDDGSTDDISNVVRELSQQDSRIVFISLDQNRGVNFARNEGIKQATGEWVSLLDSDDEYAPGGFALESSTLFRVPEYIDVVGFMTLRESNGVAEPRGFRVGESWTNYEPSYEEILFKEQIQGDIHYCIRNSVFTGGYQFAGYVNGFETAFFAKLAKDGKRFLYINSVVDLRHNGGDVHLSSVPYKRWPRQFARAYREFIGEHYEMLSTRSNVLRHFYMHIGNCMLRSGNILGVWWLIKASCLRLSVKKSS